MTYCAVSLVQFSLLFVKSIEAYETPIFAKKAFVNDKEVKIIVKIK